MELKTPEIIYILRRRKKMTQAELGMKAFGTSFETARAIVRRIELGYHNPSRSEIERLSAVLDFPLAEPTSGNIFRRKDDFKCEGKNTQISKELLSTFPGLENNLRRLEKSILIGDRDLTDYFSERVALAFRSPSNV